MENKNDDKEHFSTGAVRDKASNKPRPELISPFAMERLAVWLRDGAHKYGDRNWEAGMPSDRTMASLLRHVMKYMQGEQDEDHLAAIYCNAMFLLDLDEKTRRGILPESLLTLPTYPKPKRNDRISPLATARMTQYLRSGEESWEGVITAKECLDNLVHHLQEYLEDENDPIDHIAAAMTNLMRIVHIDEAVRRGILPADLLNLPLCRDVKTDD